MILRDTCLLLALCLACGPEKQPPEPVDDEVQRLCSERCAEDIECDADAVPETGADACVDDCTANEDWDTTCRSELVDATKCTTNLPTCSDYAAQGMGPGSPCHAEIDAYSNCVARLAGSAT